MGPWVMLMGEQLRDCGFVVVGAGAGDEENLPEVVVDLGGLLEVEVDSAEDRVLEVEEVFGQLFL